MEETLLNQQAVISLDSIETHEDLVISITNADKLDKLKNEVRICNSRCS